jgi:hypothetical protein
VNTDFFDKIGPNLSIDAMDPAKTGVWQALCAFEKKKAVVIPGRLAVGFQAVGARLLPPGLDDEISWKRLAQSHEGGGRLTLSPIVRAWRLGRPLRRSQSGMNSMLRGGSAWRAKNSRQSSSSSSGKKTEVLSVSWTMGSTAIE